jgi:hypothetical protein
VTDDDPYADLKQHRLSAEAQEIIAERIAVVPRKIQKRRRHFVIVPWSWVERLTKARYIATYRVALHILYEHWRAGGRPCTLANDAVEGIASGTKWRALRELEHLGLVTIERRKPKTPRVTALV